MATQTGRLRSLDILRGITVAGMILVNNPGNWRHVFAPLRHADWDGLTPTDLVFPFFMFIMGISMYLSLQKFNFELTKQTLLKVIKRTILIFLVGLALNWFSHGCNRSFTDFEHLRILGVMQRLAIAYGVGSIIGMMLKGKHLLWVSGFLLLIYALLIKCTGSEVLSPDNIVAVVDRNIIGESHLYQKSIGGGIRIAFDPEGLLSAVGSIVQVLLGSYCGKIILSNKNKPEAIIQKLFIFGTISLFAGLLLSYGFPINKSLWSSTFVLTTSGFASLLLGLLIWIIDIHHKDKWCSFFEVFGINPLYLYVQASVLAVVIGFSGIQDLCYEVFLHPYFGDYPTSLIWAIFFVLLNWVPGYILYKKKIYIKL